VGLVTEPADVFEVDDAETFEILVDPTRFELLERLFEPASVTELAEAMEVPRTRLYHHVRLLEETGLIRVVQVRQRGAIPEKIYQVTAKLYRPSKKLLSEYPPRQAAAALVDPLLSTTRADIIRSVTEGRFDLDEDGGYKKGMLGRHLVVLSTKRRHRFLADLKAVLDRYQDDDPEGELVAATLLVYPSSRTRPTVGSPPARTDRLDPP
jgi:DNA-binding transcriptional ArsR family regulator